MKCLPTNFLQDLGPLTTSLLPYGDMGPWNESLSHLLVGLGPATATTHLLGDLELADHPQLIIHLDAAFDQFQLCALQVREVELIDVKLLGPRQHFLLWKGSWD